MPSADPTLAASSPRPRLGALDGLRGLAALGVVVLHVWMFSYGDQHHPPKTLLDLVLGELRLGVQLFFVLSGFLVFRPFVAAALDGRPAPRLGRYALRRAGRILPAYWVVLAASFLLMRHLDHPMQVDAGALPAFLLFAQNQFDTTIKHLDPPMWTLAIEVSFYAALPLAGALALRLGRHRGRQVALGLAIVALGAAFTALSAERQWPQTVSTSLLPHLTEFGAGMTAAAALHGRVLSRRTALALGAAGAVLLAANSAWHALGLGAQQVRSDVGDAPGIAGLVLVLAALVASTWRARLLSAGPARWLGTVSYGLYLLHFPVIVALRETGRWPDTLEQQLAAVLGIALPLSAALWLVVERPAIRWAQRVTGGVRRAPAPARQRTAEHPVLRLRPAER
jgi:peptidoglycan/LPS O-acetylase OafA/YrhL